METPGSPPSPVPDAGFCGIGSGEHGWQRAVPPATGERMAAEGVQWPWHPTLPGDTRGTGPACPHPGLLLCSGWGSWLSPLVGPPTRAPPTGCPPAQCPCWLHALHPHAELLHTGWGWGTAWTRSAVPDVGASRATHWLPCTACRHPCACSHVLMLAHTRVHSQASTHHAVCAQTCHTSAHGAARGVHACTLPPCTTRTRCHACACTMSHVQTAVRVPTHALRHT